MGQSSFQIIGCNGNCNQGRTCDCVPEPDYPEPAREPLTGGDRVALVVIVIASALFAAGLIAMAARSL